MLRLSILVHALILVENKVASTLRMIFSLRRGFRFGTATRAGEFIQCLRMKALIRPEIVICRAFSRMTKQVPQNKSMNDNDVSTRALILLVPAPYQRIFILSSHSRREIKCKIIITLFLPFHSSVLAPRSPNSKKTSAKHLSSNILNLLCKKLIVMTVELGRMAKEKKLSVACHSRAHSIISPSLSPLSAKLNDLQPKYQQHSVPEIIYNPKCLHKCFSRRERAMFTFRLVNYTKATELGCSRENWTHDR